MTRRLRIDDMHEIAKPPAVLLVPLSLNYSGAHLLTIGAFGVYASPVPDDRFRIMLPRNAPRSWNVSPTPMPTSSPILLDRQTLGRGVRLTRYSRRQEAREGSRRNARPVPIDRRWEAYVFAEQGTDARTIERAAEAVAALVARSWRHGDAVDWARRALALRQRADRKREAKKS